jgi:primary-amine oxidase
MQCFTARLLAAVAGLLATSMIAAADPRSVSEVPTHPLDPLTSAEFKIIGEVVTQSGRFSQATKFAWVALSEPSKRLVYEFHPGAEFARTAALVAIDFAARQSFAVTIDVRQQRILSVVALKDAQPGLTDRDVEIAREIVSSDQNVVEALGRHGMIGEVRSLRALYLGVGTDPTLQAQAGRLVRVMFVADQDAVNDFGPVLDGLMVVVDVYARRVVVLYDHGPGAPIVKVAHDVFDPHVRGTEGGTRSVPSLTTRGNSFKIDGNGIEWSNWRFRFGFNPREGLVLYQIGFHDGDRTRSVVYRASVSEIVSRYLDRADVWQWMEFFDESSFGLGELATSVVPGREVPANAVTLSVVLAAFEEPSFAGLRTDRIYAYERDAGNLMYYRQRSRVLYERDTQLVVGFMARLGNYAYGLNWVFKQDGSFAFEAELAGEILTKLTRSTVCRSCRGLSPNPAPDRGITVDKRSGTLVGSNVLGVSHQHWFNLRLDFDVDGTDNAVVENDVRGVRPNRAPRRSSDGQQFKVAQRVLTRARDAKRDANEDVSRTWTVYNPSSLSPTGRAAGYTIVPLGNAPSLFAPRREKGPASFTFHHFWVTPERQGQLFATGRYPNQAKPDYLDNLYFYANNEAIYKQDIVVWYSLGETHVPRPEDYPLMPTMTLSVLFRPDGFFYRNPALGTVRESGD